MFRWLVKICKWPNVFGLTRHLNAHLPKLPGNAMTPQTNSEEDLPDSNTLGGTTSTGAGPDGSENAPPPETVGLDLDDIGEVARKLEENNETK